LASSELDTKALLTVRTLTDFVLRAERSGRSLASSELDTKALLSVRTLTDFVPSGRTVSALVGVERGSTPGFF
jgi:hypothetical protein